jgi:V8-like Glu-specific endopeptidase
VYGEDDRIETYETGRNTQALANSTAGMFKKDETITLPGLTMFAPHTLAKKMNLCPGERYAEQATPLDCSGFLVGPDLLVTAGHCIQDQSDCEKVGWVFDYKIDEKTGRAPVLMNNKNVYSCAQVIEAKLEATPDGKKVDYSLIKLDRKVVGRTPLKIRTSGKVKTGEKIVVIGHPSGLPQKVAGGAKVVDNAPENYFQTNLDTFGGNSGSAVFNGMDGVVEGILVRGAKDYEKSDSGCIAVHRTENEITDLVRYGESVSRITDILTLKYRSKMFEALESGYDASVIALAKEAPTVDVYDNNFNTLLHKAAAAGKTEVVDALVAKGAKLDLQNEVGETALHLAATSSQGVIVKALIEAGANVAIMDKNGQTARERASLIAFTTRNLLKNAESK